METKFCFFYVYFIDILFSNRGPCKDGPIAHDSIDLHIVSGD